MTILHATPVHDEIAGALDRLASAAELARDDASTRAVLAVVVERLEDAAGAGLGGTDGDPLVVLQRRFGRAHARVAGDRTGAVDPDLLHGLVRALQPEPWHQARRPVRAAATAALAGC